MSNPLTDELRSMLEPWLVHGRSRMSASVEDSAQAEDLARDFWIDWRAPADSSSKRNGVMDIETMELLDLFVRVDYDAAWSMILKELRLSMCLPEVLETRCFSRQQRLYPRFRIVKLENSSSIVFVQRFGVATEVFDHTPMFYAVRQAFLQAWADRYNGGNGASSPRQARDRIPVMFDLDFSRVKDCQEAHAILGHVGTLAALVDDPSRACVLNGGAMKLKLTTVFQIHSLRTHFAGAAVKDSTFHAIQTISASWNIPARKIRLGGVSHNLHEPSPVVTANFFRHTLLTQPRDKMPWTFHLLQGSSSDLFKCAISALQINTSVHFCGLSLSMTSGDSTEELWPWVAYALFSKEASHAIKRLGLNVTGITNENVGAFERVLLALDPLAAFAVPPGTSAQSLPASRFSREASVVQVGPRTVLLLRGNNGASIVELVTGEKHETLRVVEDIPGGQYICVLYPGAGICWVNRGDALAVGKVTLPIERSTSIDELDLVVVDNRSVPVMLRLLKIIGRPIKKVSIRGKSNFDDTFLDNAMLRELFTACPELKSLSLYRVTLESLQWVPSFGAGLHSLSLSDVPVEAQNGYEDFLLAVKMRRVKLMELRIQLPLLVLETLFVCVLEALDNNQLLERLQLTTLKKKAVVEPRLVTELAERNGTTLSNQNAKLSLCCKLAFLSVLNVETSPAFKKRRHNLLDMPSGLVESVFRFAAPVKTRFCGFGP